MPTHILKIVSGITAILLLMCLFHMPYGFYELVRYVVMIVFSILAFAYFSKGKVVIGVLFIALAVLFQPFWKFALGRTIWNIVDVLCSVLLVGLIFYERKSQRP